MSLPVADITVTEREAPPPGLPARKMSRLMSISSGPMSEGMIPSVRVGDRVPEGKDGKRRSDSTEHICMFSLCLMFIGVPIIVIGMYFINKVLSDFCIKMKMNLRP